MSTDQIAEEMIRGLNSIHEGYQIRADIWYTEVLFTWRWWFGVILSIVCWSVWVALRNRESTHRLLYGGMFVMLASVCLDAIGMQLKGWHYLYPTFPAIPAYLPYDMALMPVIIMFILQYKPRLNPVIKGIFFSAIAAFIGEPVFKWIGIYQPLVWRSLYSLPVYFVIFLIAHWLTSRNRNAPIQ